ncbi:hypothetical protein L218DRAFT_841240, partial [Marasmius fiardii PR-910]
SWQAFMSAELPWNALAGTLTFFCWFYPIGLWRNPEPTDAVTERKRIEVSLHFDIYSAEAGGGIANLSFSLSL